MDTIISGGSLVALNGGVPTVLSVTDGALSVCRGYQSSVTITRPNNTTAYSSGDVIGGVVEFQSIGPEGGFTILTDVTLMANVASVPSGMAGMRLHLYASSPSSALTDNAAWDLAASDRLAYRGYIDIGTPADFGSTLWAESRGNNKQVKLGSSSTSIFAYLQTLGAFTPTAQAVKTITLNSLMV